MVSLNQVNYVSYSSTQYLHTSRETAEQGTIAATEEDRNRVPLLDDHLSTRVNVRATKVELYQNVAQERAENPYAATILSHISGQLALDAADGASQEELQSRWEAGLQGFMQGFNEAREQLEAIGALDPNVASEIGDTYDRVLDGLAKEAEKYGLDDSALDQYLDEGPETSLTAPLDFSASDFNLGNSINGQHVEALARSRDFSFQLKTADGDLVLIEAATSQAKAAASYRDGGVNTGSAYAAESSSSFSFSVQGELDEGELKAINDLLGQVNQISDTFFNGDVYDAFNLALDVGYDSSEISSFALKLTQTEVQQVNTSYAPSHQNNAPSLKEQLAPVSHFAHLVEHSSSLVAKLNLDSSLIAELADQFAQANYPDHPRKDDFKPFVSNFLEG